LDENRPFNRSEADAEEDDPPSKIEASLDDEKETPCGVDCYVIHHES
jgi:hypothetical protein